jgi:hypothetical protein
VVRAVIEGLLGATWRNSEEHSVLANRCKGGAATGSRGDGRTSNGSSGLGLAIVKRVLDRHGSVVRLHSAFMRGIRFANLLPQAA